MKIEYFGHSCFRLTESTGTAIVCDPYSPEVGYSMPQINCDVVTISHHHFDHDYLAAVDGNPKVIEGECFCDFEGVEIGAIKSFHDSKRGKKRGENTIFKFRMDGLDICHLGDLGENCSPELIELILPVNVLLIPVGGTYTLDAQMAKEYVDRIMPDIVIPMHFDTKDGKLGLDKVDEFIELFDDESVSVSVLSKSEIELSRNDLAGDTKIIVLSKK